MTRNRNRNRLFYMALLQYHPSVMPYYVTIVYHPCKGCFTQCVNELCTEFAFAHPKLLQIYGTSFYGPIYGIFIVKNLCLLAKPGMVTILNTLKVFTTCFTIKPCNSHGKKYIH